MEGSARTDRAPGAVLEPVALPNLALRALQVFHSPGELFERLRARPVWAGPLLMVALAVALSALLVPVEVWEVAFREQMLRAGREMPEGFAFGRIGQVSGVVGGAVGAAVWIFVLAGVMTLIFHLLLGDEGRYKQYLSVASHAALIAAAGALLLVPLKVAQADPQVTLNLGLFVPMEEGSYGHRVLRTLDLFGLWSYAVMAVGISQIDPRRSWGSAAVVMLGLAVVLAMVIALFGRA